MYSYSTAFSSDALTVYCPNGANAPRYRACLPAISYGIATIKMIGSVGLNLNNITSYCLTLTDCSIFGVRVIMNKNDPLFPHYTIQLNAFWLNTKIVIEIGLIMDRFCS